MATRARTPAAWCCASAPPPALWGRLALWEGVFEELNSLLLATRLWAGQAEVAGTHSTPAQSAPSLRPCRSGKAPRGAVYQLVSGRRVGRAEARRQAEDKAVPPSPLGHRGVACSSTGRGWGAAGTAHLGFRSRTRRPPRSEPRPPPRPFSAGPEAPAGSRAT